MNASIQGALNQLNKSYLAFKHRGESMTKIQVKTVLEYGLKRGYESTNQLSDEEVDNILKDLLIKEAKKVSKAQSQGTLTISGLNSDKKYKVPKF